MLDHGVIALGENEMVLLHAIIKKSRVTPKTDLSLVKARRNQCFRARTTYGGDRMNDKKPNKHGGSNFNDFLRDEGILEECTASAVKAVLAMEIADAMKENHTTKRALAERMHSSRSQLD